MHQFSPDNAARLERQERHDLLRPVDTLKVYGVAEGMTVVDVGAGTGFFARAAAGLVGPSGRVYAADISEQMLGHFRTFGVPGNVTLLQSDPLHIPLHDGVADMVLAAFVVHEAPDRSAFIRELMRLAKPGGTVLVLEWIRQEEEHGPPMEERLAESDLDADLARYRVLQAGRLNQSHYVRFLERS